MKELYKALAAFQQECPIIAKESKAYNYKYADLPSIVEIINPILKKHNLGFIQPLQYAEGVRKIQTIVFHTETGNSIESIVDIPEVEFKGMNLYQSMGSGITYLRRYALSSALGIVTDEDTDAQGEQVKSTMKELPWLSQKQFDASVKRIQEANPNVHITEDGNDLELTPDDFLDKLTAGFRMKKDFKEALKTEIEFQKMLLNAPEKPQDVDIPIEPTIPY